MHADFWLISESCIPFCKSGSSPFMSAHLLVLFQLTFHLYSLVFNIAHYPRKTAVASGIDVVGAILGPED